MTESKVPAEWSEQSAVWITWPSQERWWSSCRLEALEAFAGLASKIAEYETVKINCPPEGAREAEKFLIKAGCAMENVIFLPHETDDVWCRDCGAIFRLAGGKLEAVDFKYNAWGGKFEPFDRDDALAAKMAAACGIDDIRINFTCEGGAVETDGNGTLMTTKSVALNPNRNPGISQSEAEEILTQAYGARRVLWLDDGLFNDDTDGHIDNAARFAPGGKIVASVCPPDNPSHESLKRNLQALKRASGADGVAYEVLELPLPDEPLFKTGAGGVREILPAGYANWLVVNGAVLMPSFGQPKSDARAREIIGSAFAGRKIEMIDSRIFLLEGGAVHCLTQQQPAAQTNPKI